MNQKTVRQLKRFARENKVDFRALKERWESTPWTSRHAFRQEVLGNVTTVAAAKQERKEAAKKASKSKKAS